MGRRVGALVGVLAVGLLVSGCALVGTDSYWVVGSGPATAEPADTFTGPWIESWTSEPTAALEEFRAAAAERCFAAKSPRYLERPPIVDQRGPDGAAFLWVGEDSRSSACLVLREDGALEALPAGGGTGEASTFTDDDGSQGVVVRVVDLGPGLERVGFTTDDGEVVRPPVQDGWALAGWPSAVDPEARLFGSTGRLDFVSPVPSPD